MSDADLIPVEVAYALPDRQTLLRLDVPAGTTLADAVRRSGVLEAHPEIDLTSAKTGIFGHHAPSDHVLRSGDRVEIYRPLIADPKAARRKRARQAKDAD